MRTAAQAQVTQAKSANQHTVMPGDQRQAVSLQDTRPEAVQQQQRQVLADQSARVMQLQPSIAMMNGSARAQPRAALPQLRVNQSAPLQRKVTFTETDESYTDMIAFVTKYGTGDIGKGVTAKLVEIQELVTSGDHSWANVGAMLDHLGYVPEVEALEFKVSMVVSKLGDLGVAVEEDTVFSGTKSSKQSSHPLFEVTIDGKKFMLKKEPEGKSEFMGMEEMSNQGIKVPAAMLLFIENHGEFLLMEYITSLGPGLGTMNAIPELKLGKAASDLGKMHATDIRIGNVDRLPWRGNGGTGHLNNVFTDVLSREIVGLDSELNVDIKDDLLAAIKQELHDIEADAATYAANMYAFLIKDGNKDKLVMSDGKRDIFIEHFAAGLTAALPEDIDGLYAQLEDDGLI